MFYGFLNKKKETSQTSILRSLEKIFFEIDRKKIYVHVNYKGDENCT